MSDQAQLLRGLMEARPASLFKPDAPPQTTARTIAVTSGKGGVGKSVIALNLAIALARLDARVCLLDADMGLGNIDLLCGLNGYWNLSHVVTGARTLKDIILKGPAGVSVIPGTSGLAEVADCPEPAQREILSQMKELEQQHDFLVIDTGTGIHRTIRQFVRAADVALIVTTPEPTSIASAYATIKALSTGETPELELVVNESESAEQARAIANRLQQTSRVFLHAEIHSHGSIPRDSAVPASVAKRVPLVFDAPHAPATRAIHQLARRVKKLADGHTLRGEFFTRLWSQLVSRAA
jgi:flagellar biosynthesis protein FlhG